MSNKTWVQKMADILTKERKSGLIANPQLSVAHGQSVENIAKSFCQIEKAYRDEKCILLCRTSGTL